MCPHVEKKTEQNINMPILCGKKMLRCKRKEISMEIFDRNFANFESKSIKRVYCLFEICYSEGLSLAVGDVYDI